MDVSFQTIFNIVLAICGTLGIFILNMIFARIVEARAAGVAEAQKAALAAELAKAFAERELEAERRDRLAAIAFERAERERAVDAERRGREDDRHALRDDIGIVSNKLNAFMLEVAKDCINSERLTAALEPMNDALAGIKSDVARVFEKLDGKMDKRPGGD